jgi:hypothetical protein
MLSVELYLWKKSYAFEALRFKYGHNRLYNGGMMVIE